MIKHVKQFKPLALILGIVILLSAAVCLGNLFAVADVDTKTVNVYLIAGQSNATGYGENDLADAGYSDSRYTSGYENVLYYGWRDVSGTLSDALTDDFVPVKAGLGRKLSTGELASGAELGIATELGDSDSVTAVIKCAWGGSFLAPDTADNVSKTVGTWTSPSYISAKGIAVSGTKTGELYTQFKTVVASGLEKLKSAGYTPVIKGIWWMQGEAEIYNQTYQNSYAELLTALISDMRSDLGSMTGTDCSTLPFGIGQIYRNPEYTQYDGVEVIRGIQQTVADSVTNAFTVDCTGLKQRDAWHFYASGQIYLGQQFVRGVAVCMNGGGQVVYNSDDGGVVTLTGTGYLEYNTQVTLGVTVKRGYEIVSVTVRDENGQIETTLNGNVITFVMADGDVSVTVEVQANGLNLMTATVNDINMGSCILSSAAKNGWFGSETVVFTVIPRAGYAISSVTVNGNAVSSISYENGKYLYSVVADENVTVTVAFIAVNS